MSRACRAVATALLLAGVQSREVSLPAVAAEATGTPHPAPSQRPPAAHPQTNRLRRRLPRQQGRCLLHPDRRRQVPHGLGQRGQRGGPRGVRRAQGRGGRLRPAGLHPRVARPAALHRRAHPPLRRLREVCGDGARRGHDRRRHHQAVSRPQAPVPPAVAAGVWPRGHDKVGQDLLPDARDVHVQHRPLGRQPFRLRALHICPRRPQPSEASLVLVVLRPGPLAVSLSRRHVRGGPPCLAAPRNFSISLAPFSAGSTRTSCRPTWPARRAS